MKMKKYPSQTNLRKLSYENVYGHGAGDEEVTGWRKCGHRRQDGKLVLWGQSLRKRKIDDMRQRRARWAKHLTMREEMSSEGYTEVPTSERRSITSF